MRDGVLIAEVIEQKLEGRAQIDVKLQFAEPAPVRAGVASPPSPAPPTNVIAATSAAARGGGVAHDAGEDIAILVFAGGNPAIRR